MLVLHARKIRKVVSFCLIGAFVAVALFGSVGLVYAQEETSDIRIGQMNIAIWPEYDDPRVLVIHQLKVAEPINYPFRISFLIPKDAEVNMGCEVAESGGHGCRPYRIEDRGDFNELSFEVSSRPTLFMEYYYQPLKNSSNKSFDFVYKPLYPVDSLNVEVQQPLKATDFSTEPAATDTYSDNKGFNYSILKLGSVKKNQPVKVKVSYSKSGSQPSISRQTGDAGRENNVQPNNPNTARMTILVLALLCAVFASVVGYQFVAMRRRRGEELLAEESTQSISEMEKAVSAKRVCSSCGASLKKSDKFCSSCGAKAKT